MMSRFKQTSDEKMSDLKRGNESPPGLFPPGPAEIIKQGKSPTPGSFFDCIPFQKGREAMREITAEAITAAVRDLCVDANRVLPADLEALIQQRAQEEGNGTAQSILCDLCRNLDAAREMAIPICQDTGMAVIFAEVGQDVHICGDFEAAVNEGVRQGYVQGLLRCSVVRDPLRRGNTEDNTPAILHTRLAPGDKLTLTVAPKGFGSENMSRLKMFTPAAKVEDIVAFVKETVEVAGSNPCPPVVLGVGIGGDFELVAMLAKKSLCRSVSQRNPDPFYAELEERMLQAVNSTGVGPQGFGGETTALAVNIEAYPTHIAGLPVAVNVGCHVTRHKSVTTRYLRVSIQAQNIALCIAIFWTMCYNKAREAESFLRPDRGFPAFPNLTKGVSASPVGSMGRADGCLVMKITIVGRKVNLRNNFKELAERKLSKFNRIFDEDAEATVTVTVERNRQTVEITIKQRGMIYRAEETSLEMNEALDHVIAALGRQIRRNKTRLEKAKKVDPNIDFPDALYDEPDEEIHVVRTKSFYVKVMTPEEAILQMNMLGHQFFMFRDDSTGEINVVYRRKDGDYGLLVPESK